MSMSFTRYHKTGLTLISGIVLAVLVLIFFSWLAEEVFEGDTQHFDEQLRSIINQHSSPLLTSVMRVATYLGSTIFLLAILACATLALYFWMKWRDAALILVITMAGALLLNTVLKLAFHRSRPDPFFGIVAPSSYSFPSGHALFSVCFYSTLAALINRRIKNRSIRVVIWSVAALLIVLIGFSRIYLGVHYPSDVVAGYLAAIIWVMAVSMADHLLHNSQE